MSEKKGKIIKISGPLVGAVGLKGVKMNEVVRVGKDNLIGEIVELHGEKSSIQVYEETGGIKPGEEVVATGSALSVDLGPGLVGSIFDGIQRPLDVIRNQTGDFIARGVQAHGLDRKKKWDFKAEVKKGDKVSGGTVIGTVEESPTVQHRVMVPPGVEGKITRIDSGKFTIVDDVAEVKDKSGKTLKLQMMQKWPVRTKRPYIEKIPPEEPLISGQRVIDTFFPIAKGGIACIPGPFGSGKCVSPRTPVLLATGDIENISEIYEKYKNRGKRKEKKDEEYTLLDKPFGVLGYSNGKIKNFNVKAVYRGKTEKFLKITTRSGRELEVTPAHGLLTFEDLKEEKVPAGKLKAGDYLLMPRKLPAPSCGRVKFPWKEIYGEFRIVEAEVLKDFHRQLQSLKGKYKTLKKLAEELDIAYDKLMGYWLKRNRPTLNMLIRVFKLADKETPPVNKLKDEKQSVPVIIKKEYDRDFALFLGLLAGDGQVKGRSIRFYNNDPALKQFYRKLLSKVFSIKGREFSMRTVDVVCFESPVVKKLLDYTGFPEYRKSVQVGLPKGILRESKTIMAAYLSGMILSDGHVNSSKREIEIRSSSQRHYRGLSYLLAFMGVGASYRKRKGKNAYRIFIRGRVEIEKILKLSNVSIGKFKKLSRHASCGKADYNSWDIVPLSPAFIEKVYDKIKRPYRKLKNMGVEIFNYLQGENMGISVFRKFASMTDSEHIKSFAGNHLNSIFIDRIEKIEDIDSPPYVYDIEVEEAHNFIGGSIPALFSNTVVQQQLAKWTDAEVVVYIGCGERGNEMTDVLQEFPELEDPYSGEPLIKRTVLIANTSNMPVAAREASIYTGTTIAEYFRDMGYKVALMADSTSRWAEALREMSGRLEEMPGEEGYPAYLASRVAEFYERGGRVRCLGGDREGSLSIIGAVSPPGGDLSDPMVKNTLRVVKVFWGLDDDLSSQRHFPAIHWLRSYSLYGDALRDYYEREVGEGYTDLRKQAMSILQKEESLEEIVRLVGEESLSDKDRQVLDTAKMIREDFLQQHAFDPDETFTHIKNQYRMISAIMKYHKRALEYVEAGNTLAELKPGKVKEKIARMKFYEGGKSEDFDKLDGEIEKLFASSASEDDIGGAGAFTLGNIDGIGETTARLLIEKGYDSPEKIKNAGVESLAEIEGIGEKTAKKIIDQIEQTNSERKKDKE